MKQAVTIKTITAIIAITAAIITISIFSQNILHRDSDILVQYIEKVEDSIKKDDWNQAENHINQNVKIWEDMKGTWSALVDHQEIDNIDVTMTRLETLIKTNDVSSALSEAAALKKFVSHIPNKEKPSLDNIF